MTVDRTDRAPPPGQTREVLANLRASAHMLRNFRVPEMRESARAVERLGAQEATVARPKESILDQARRNLVAAAASVGIANADARDLREAPWLLWAEQEPLAAQLPTLLETMWMVAARRPSMQRKLIQ